MYTTWFLFQNRRTFLRNFVLLNRAFNTFKSTTTFLWRASLRLELSFMTCLRNDKRVEVPLLKFQLFAYWSVGTQEKGPSFYWFFHSPITQGRILRLCSEVRSSEKLSVVTRKGFCIILCVGKSAHISQIIFSHSKQTSTDRRK